jgi:thioredoxin-dependent peroxiredoxin
VIRAPRPKLEIGDRAPAFELAGSGGQTHRLEDYRGEWVILAFYPGDFTPVCTRQFCSYRDGADRLDQLGASVLGISPQSADSHDRFVAEYGLTIPLLADPERRVVKAYGVLGPGGLVRRSVFIVDPEGVVRYRHVALLGLHYKDVAGLGTALERARRNAPAPS